MDENELQKRLFKFAVDVLKLLRRLTGGIDLKRAQGARRKEKVERRKWSKYDVLWKRMNYRNGYLNLILSLKVE